MSPGSSEGEPPRLGTRFATTVWSRVLRAAASDDVTARPAMAELCQAYWYPLYAYARKRGGSPAEAEDSVQAFFAWLLEKNLLRRAEPERGRFRGFLVASFQQFLARQHAHDSAQKRRPTTPLTSINTSTGELRYDKELTDEVTPERLFEYTWALSVVQRVMDQLRAEAVAGGRVDRFDAFQGMMTDQGTTGARELGQSLGMSEGAVRVAVHRMKQRYGELLRQEIAVTLDEGEDVNEEIRYLMNALRCPQS